ncbi:alpha/beta hydrolase family protein [Qipengyuania xiapuensis]|uniref:alpha/beta hydrolase family protein n=1 Tax=Qipengyuania xiapuensis TaxID=2867236 RepID=UPI001FFD2ACF|nr:alpha/beta fold hydrolase [Qipengyuania xiapuensis]
MDRKYFGGRMLKLGRFLPLFAAVLLISMGTAAHAQVDEPPPLSAYGALPGVEMAAISPSGANIAVLTTIGETRLVLFLGPDMRPIRKMEVGDSKVRSLDWIGDDRVLLQTSKTEDLWGFTVDKAELFSAHIVPVTYDGEVTTVFKRTRRLVDAVFGSHGIRFVDGRWQAYFGALELRRDRRDGYTFNHSRPYLYRFTVDTQDATRIATATGEDHYRDWLVGSNGGVAAVFDLARSDGDWKISNSQGVAIAEGTHAAGRVGLVGLGYEGASVIYYLRDEDGVSHWYEVPLAGGASTPFLPDADVDRLYFDTPTGRLTGYLDAEDGPVFADPTHQMAVSRIRKAFAKYDMRMVDWTPNFEKVLVRTSGNGDSGSWYVVDLGTMRADGFAYERMRILPDMVGPISTFSYTAADGLDLDGILTLPPGREAKNLPLVMLPHGGPHAHDREQFDWWAQAFASRGYAVFQPNFRGSTNREQAFKLAGYGEWGRKMQTDLSDGLAALAEKGIVDPDRACIVGASYGGYAALAGVTLQQGLYQCAVAVAPVSDIGDMYNEDYRASGRQRITKAALLEQLGPKDRWDAVSPRRHADQADAPIMLIHGEDDTVVPYDHSYKMADKLKDAGKPYELVTLEGEDHWLSLSSTRQQMLEAAVGFVEKHNPAD